MLVTEAIRPGANRRLAHHDRRNQPNRLLPLPQRPHPHNLRALINRQQHLAPQPISVGGFQYILPHVLHSNLQPND